MIPWLMIAQAIAIAVAGLVVIVAGVAKAKLSDWVLAVVAGATVTLIVQAVASIIAPLAGQHPTGFALEYWTYLVIAALIPAGTVLWAFTDKERSRWALIVIGIGLLAVAIMVYRMHQIWFVQVW